jgi:hypothetical protein
VDIYDAWFILQDRYKGRKRGTILLQLANESRFLLQVSSAKEIRLWYGKLKEALHQRYDILKRSVLLEDSRHFQTNPFPPLAAITLAAPALSSTPLCPTSPILSMLQNPPSLPPSCHSSIFVEQEEKEEEVVEQNIFEPGFHRERPIYADVMSTERAVAIQERNMERLSERLIFEQNPTMPFIIENQPIRLENSPIEEKEGSLRSLQVANATRTISPIKDSNRCPLLLEDVGSSSSTLFESTAIVAIMNSPTVRQETISSCPNPSSSPQLQPQQTSQSYMEWSQDGIPSGSFQHANRNPQQTSKSNTASWRSSIEFEPYLAPLPKVPLEKSTENRPLPQQVRGDKASMGSAIPAASLSSAKPETLSHLNELQQAIAKMQLKRTERLNLSFK